MGREAHRPGQKQRIGFHFQKGWNTPEFDKIPQFEKKHVGKKSDGHPLLY